MTEIVPQSDTFTEESTHLGDIHSGYARIVAWTTDSSSGDSNVCAAGNLHNGYFQGGGTLAIGTTGRFAAAQHASAGAADLLGFVWRPFYAVRAKARLAFRWKRVSGSVTAVEFRRAAVGVRLQSHGSYVNTAGSEAVSGGDGYWLVARNVASQPGAKFYLLRVNSGTVTKLTESSVVDVSTWSLGTGMWMYVTVSNSGGNPVLRCRRSPSAREAVDGTVEVDCFAAGDYTDTSGSKITTAGRCGFALTRPTTGSATLADWFEVTDVASGEVVLRDEWLRANYLVGALTSADANSRTGRNLQPIFAGDVGGSSSNRIARDSGNNRVKNDGTNTAIAGACSLRASHESIQRRSLSVQFPGGGSYVDVLTMDVRGKDLHAPTGANTRSYRLELTMRVSPVDTIVRVYSVSGGVATQLAQIVSGYNTSAHVWEIDVQNVGGATAYDGVPHIVVRKDSTALTNWTLSAVPGISQLSTGAIVDARSSAILTGWEQGFSYAASSGTSNRVYLDSWTDLASLPTAEDDLPSATVSGELDGMTGTLSVPLSWPVETVPGWPSLRHEYDSDHAQAFATGSRERRTWKVQAKAAKDSEVATLRSFYGSHGCEVPFTWVLPSGETVHGVFLTQDLTDVLKDRGSDGGVSTFSFEVQERFA